MFVHELLSKWPSCSLKLTLSSANDLVYVNGRYINCWSYFLSYMFIADDLLPFYVIYDHIKAYYQMLIFMSSMLIEWHDRVHISIELSRALVGHSYIWSVTMHLHMDVLPHIYCVCQHNIMKNVPLILPSIAT